MNTGLANTKAARARPIDIVTKKIGINNTLSKSKFLSLLTANDIINAIILMVAPTNSILNIVPYPKPSNEAL